MASFLLPMANSGIVKHAVSNNATSQLSQSLQNGGGTWGTLQNAALPASYGASAGSLSLTALNLPWGGINAFNTNPYTGAPNTGLTRFYDLHIAQCTIAPDGVQIPGQLCVNGQFPGPLIEANYGDTIQVTVHNDITDRDEGTSMHWHGFLQTGTPWEDGVPSVSQCPIIPGSSYTYNFRAELYGTSWYHSHYSAQYIGGAMGPIVVYGPASAGHDIDLGPVMLQDWYHSSYSRLVEDAMAPIGAPNGPDNVPSNNVLINGKMRYNCSNTDLQCLPGASFSQFRFRSGAVHKLRLINNGAQGVQKFSIDDHNITVIANDFVPVEPYTVDHVSLGVGQRADVLVNGTGAPDGAYWMRSSMTDHCSTNDGISPIGYAAIYYEHANTSRAPTTNSTFIDVTPFNCANVPLQSTVPAYPIAMDAPSTTETINIRLVSNGTNLVYQLNGIQHKTNFDVSLLNSARRGQTTFQNSDAVYNYGSNTTVRIVFYNYDGIFHPMHLHGHNFQILSDGWGEWDGTVVRASNPQRRDTALMRPARETTPSWLVLQWTANNPGLWALHCHIAFHLSAGLYMTVLEGAEELARDLKYAQISSATALTCPQWNAWAYRNVVDTIDDGV